MTYRRWSKAWTASMQGGTALRDAIQMALDYGKVAENKEKRALLVITDGNDNASRSSLDRIVRQAQESESVVYAIGLFSQEKRAEWIICGPRWK